MDARRRVSVFLALPLIVAWLLLVAAQLHLRQTWQAERAFGNSINSMKQGQLQPAEQQLRAALAIAPDNAHYYSHLAILHERMLGIGIEPFALKRASFDQGQLDHLRAAVQSYQNTLRINPRDDAAYHNLGWLYWFMGQDEQAIECARTAVDLDSTAYLYRITLGLLHELRGEKDAAFTEYETALYISPGLLDSRFFRDLHRRWPEQMDGLVANTTLKLETKLRDGFDPVVAGKLGRMYLNKQPERALELLEAATRALPNLSRPWANLGRLYELQGNNARMRECYERTVFLDRSDVLAWYRLGVYHDSINEAQDAARNYERAINIFLNPESIHSGKVRRIYHSRFTLFDDVIPRGLLAYTAANIDIPQACRRLSQIYLEKGDKERAKYFAELVDKYAGEIDFAADTSWGMGKDNAKVVNERHLHKPTVSESLRFRKP